MGIGRLSGNFVIVDGMNLSVLNLLADAQNLSSWQNFYVIVGSSAGALIGIQFVVIALIASTRRRTDAESINAFGTPNVVHFSSALSVSAIMSAPWSSMSAPSAALVMCGVGGVFYAALVFRRARRQTSYKPVLEDWVWYAILPCVVYAVLTAALLILWKKTTTRPLFVIAGAALALLLIGVRNAWDSVTHLVIVAGQRREGKKPGAGAEH